MLIGCVGYSLVQQVPNLHSAQRDHILVPFATHVSKQGGKQLCVLYLADTPEYR
jgi:hypothetical protein